MSINSLATSQVARDISRSTGKKELSLASEDAFGPKEQDVQNALSALVEYLPSETVVLYLATVASLPVLVEVLPWLGATQVYAAFAVLTPILFALVYGGKRRAAGEERWPGLKQWPWWPMIAATVAFLAWALTVPEGPLVTTASGRVLSGLAAIFVSTLLGVLGRFFSPKPRGGDSVS